jgi:hypothetical protein
MSQVLNFGSGLLNGILSLFGAGSLYDPLGDERSKVNDIKDKISNLTTLSTLKHAKNVDTALSNMIKLINITDTSTKNIINQTNTFVNDSLQKENYFISFIYILVFILIFFFLSQKKCC